MSVALRTLPLDAPVDDAIERLVCLATRARISSAVLCQTKGLGASLLIVRYSRIAVSSARVLRCAPRLICFWVSVANHRSTKLSQDALVGVKCA